MHPLFLQRVTTLRSQRNLFSSSELRRVMSNARLDMSRWNVYVRPIYARSAALQRGGGKNGLEEGG